MAIRAVSPPCVRAAPVFSCRPCAASSGIHPAARGGGGGRTSSSSSSSPVEIRPGPRAPRKPRGALDSPRRGPERAACARILEIAPIRCGQRDSRRHSIGSALLRDTCAPDRGSKDDGTQRRVVAAPSDSKPRTGRPARLNTCQFAAAAAVATLSCLFSPPFLLSRPGRGSSSSSSASVISIFSVLDTVSLRVIVSRSSKIHIVSSRVREERYVSRDGGEEVWEESG